MATPTSEIKDSSDFVVSLVEDVLEQNSSRSSDVGVFPQRVEESLPDESSKSESSVSAEETSSAKKSSNQNLPQLNVDKQPLSEENQREKLKQNLPQLNAEKQALSEEDQREKVKQSEFVQGILSSVILKDDK